jgi:hypothetical protein
MRRMIVVVTVGTYGAGQYSVVPDDLRELVDGHCGDDRVIARRLQLAGLQGSQQIATVSTTAYALYLGLQAQHGLQLCDEAGDQLFDAATNVVQTQVIGFIHQPILQAVECAGALGFNGQITVHHGFDIAAHCRVGDRVEVC